MIGCKIEVKYFTADAIRQIPRWQCVNLKSFKMN